MISHETLQKAADKNLIHNNQVEPLYQFIYKEAQNRPTIKNTEEPLKFVRSFGDVFITLGIFLIVMSINMASLTGYYYLIPVAIFIVIAEWLVRIRRLVLPGIAILLSILYFINKAFLSIDPAIFGLNTTSLIIISISCLLFYLRYNMPFSLLPLTASLIALVTIQIGLDILEKPFVFVLSGLTVFCFAMWFDIRDTQRKSHLSDSAFWLHLLAAPLIVHGSMISLLAREQAISPLISNDLLMGVFFIFLFLLALFIDRRALLISTQLYAIYALTQFFQNDLISSQHAIIYVLMTLGVLIIFFGTYWYKTRQIIFSLLKNKKISQYVPDFNVPDNKISTT